MSTSQKIASEVSRLRPEEQSEVLDFVEFLKRRSALKQEREFKDFSLSSAMRGMEDEPDLYSAEDIRESLS